jgi:hypothetical protein
MTEMTPGRALYDYRRPGDLPPAVAWEELAEDDREFYEEQARAAIAASQADLRDIGALAEATRQVEALRQRLGDLGALIDEMLADIERAVPGWAASGKTSLWRLRRTGDIRVTAPVSEDPPPVVPWQAVNAACMAAGLEPAQVRPILEAAAAGMFAVERERIWRLAIRAHATTRSPSGRVLPFEELIRRSPEENARGLLAVVERDAGAAP